MSFRQYAGMPQPMGSPAAPQGNGYGDFLMQLMPQMMQQAQARMTPTPPPDPALQAGTYPGSPLGQPPAPMPPQATGQTMMLGQPPQMPVTMPPQMPMQQAAPLPPPPPPPPVSPDPGYQRGAFLQMMRQGAGRF